MPPKGKAPAPRSSARPASKGAKPPSKAASKAPASITSGKSRKRGAPDDEDEEDENGDDVAEASSSKAPASKRAKTGGSGGTAGRVKGGPATIQEEDKDAPEVDMNAGDQNGHEGDVPMEDLEQEAAPKPNGRASTSLTNGNGKAKPPSSASSARAPAKPRNKTVAALASGSGSAGLTGKKRDAIARRSVASSVGSASGRRKFLLNLPKPADHLRPARTLLIWGNGDYPVLGLGIEGPEEITRPRIHKFFEEAIEDGLLGGEGAGLEAVAAGGLHNVVIDEKGRVWTWGVNDEGACGRITAGPVDRTLRDPRLDGADSDTRSQLDRETLETTPGMVQRLADEGFRAVVAVASDNMSMVIDDKGDLRYWGAIRFEDGSMGTPAGPKQEFPVPFPKGIFKAGMQFANIACGSDHFLILNSEGKVYTMGHGEQGRLGRKLGSRTSLTKAATPEPLGLKNIELVAAGSYHSFAVDAEGRVYGWGSNAFNQTGVANARLNRSWENGVVPTPTIVDALLPDNLGGARVRAISAGDHHSVFLLSDGSVWACGELVNGSVGLADDHPAMTEEAREQGCVAEPVQVFFPPSPTEDDKTPALSPFEDTDEYRKESSRIVNIGGGSENNMAVSANGHVYTWGGGTSSQLGLGPDTARESVPTLINNRALNEVKAVFACSGGQHSILLATRKAPAA